MERADLEQWKAREVARLLALVETERRYYQEIAASIPVGLLVLSGDLAVVSANRAIRKIFGLHASPLQVPAGTLLPAWVLDRIAEVLKTGSPQTGILVSDSKTGRRLRIGILALRGWDGESSPEALLSIEDLSGVEALTVPVPAGGSPIAGAQMMEQLTQSERVQAISKLAGRMAHDLNNILMIVTGHSEEVLNGLPPNSPLRADVQEILNATERISGLTSHLLAFTRRQSAAASPVDLHKVLRAVEQRLGLQFNLPSAPTLVKADAARLEQLLAALIERERQVAIDTSIVEIKEDLGPANAPLGPGRYAVINITLSGRALDAGAKSSWFEAALPAKDPSDDWPSAVTRAYVAIRQWGGDIVASAAPRGGTLLSVFLESAADAVETSRAPSAAPRPETILVVDDEPRIRELIQKILRRQGYEVLEAGDGEQALAVFREHPGAIDLLISDVMMPRMGGPELVDRLRRQGLNPRVLYVSGYTDDPNISAGKFGPGTAFLEKPFTLTSLLGKVREVLKTPLFPA